LPTFGRPTMAMVGMDSCSFSYVPSEARERYLSNNL